MNEHLPIAIEPVDPNERFPIRVLSERTGVATSTLRAWERRYRLLAPERTPKGHRLYNLSDVELVNRTLALLEEGHSLSAIAAQLNSSESKVSKSQDKLAQSGVWHDYIIGTMLAISDFSHERIEAIFNEASSLYPLDMVTDRLIEPVLIKLGSDWQDKPTGIAEEHFYSNWVRNRLAARFHHGYGQSKGARIVCACLPGAYHEIGLLLFSLAALTRGYRILYFGANLPLEQIPLILTRSGARGVILSSRDLISADQDKQLGQIVETCRVPVMLGGNAADQAAKHFELAGGMRLGSNISVALQLLSIRVPVHSGAARA